MEKSIALLTCLLVSIPCARAATSPDNGTAPQTNDLITPLDVRDPSALVMGTERLPALTITAPAPAAATAPTEAKRQASDKSGPRRGERSVGLAMGEDQLLSVKPGDRVDLLAVFDASSSSGAKSRFAATILQNVRVLGVASVADLRGKGVLTLELNPVEAQYAALAASQADLSVAVRAPGDVELHPMEMSNFLSLFR